MSKIFEKLLLKRMSTFLTKHKILSPNQFGFRADYNCTNAITEITEYIRQESDKRNRGYVCFIDLKKAFDTIDHELLSGKLELYGFRGVLQVSILGPFLFILYIKDLPDCNPESRIALFADDNSLYNFEPNANDEICDDVKTARSWFKDNKLTINTNKPGPAQVGAISKAQK